MATTAAHDDSSAGSSAHQHQHHSHEKKVALIVGLGLPGYLLAKQLLKHHHWTVYGVSKRAPTEYEKINNPRFHYIVLDLAQAGTDAELAKHAGIKDVTHLYYTCYMSCKGEKECIDSNSTIFQHALSATDLNAPKLERVILVTGTQYYGSHLGPYRTPCEETDPRHAGDNYFFHQEDFLKQYKRPAGGAGTPTWTYSIVRPTELFGFVEGSVFNFMTTIAVYALLCKKTGQKFQFPGTVKSYTALVDCVDGDQLTSLLFFLGSKEDSRTANQAFNCSNGDCFRWSTLWASIAKFFQVEVGHPDGDPKRIVTALENPAMQEAWKQVLATPGIVPHTLTELCGAPFADWLLAREYTSLSNTNKAYEAGFHRRSNTEASFLRQLQGLRDAKIIP